MSGKRVLICCAMPEEYTNVVNSFKEQKEYVRDELPDMCTFTAQNFSVIVSCTGIGMVNAAAHAAVLLFKTRADIVLNAGCAGAHNSVLRIGDVVIGSFCVSTSNIIVNPDGEAKHYGVRCTNGREMLRWEADPWLLRMSDDTFRTDFEFRVVNGGVGSSDTWLDNVDRVKSCRGLFQTDCEDMEAAAIAQVSHAADTPFLCIKDISNSVFIRDDPNFEPYSHKAPQSVGNNAATFVVRLCGLIRDGCNPECFPPRTVHGRRPF